MARNEPTTIDELRVTSENCCQIKKRERQSKESRSHARVYLEQ
jgi:hypothetical protein